MAAKSTSAKIHQYSAMLLFQFRVITSGVSNKRRLCEKRLILFTAPNRLAALREARRQGRVAQHNYLNSKGGEVRFEFVGLLNLLQLGPEFEPDEVYYEICTLLTPMERRARLLLDESRMQAIVED